MIYLAFKLSMPGSPSWNGRWSGENNLYVKVLKYKKIPPTLTELETKDSLSFSHRWDDGWCASVSVTVVDSDAAKKLKKKSDGFCGYDWMVTDILSKGYIEKK